jgi:TDG/mug DNA glycosylase family protein
MSGARVWLLPNPSGLQAHYQFGDLVIAFADLRAAVGASSPHASPAGPEETSGPAGQ